VLHPRQEGCQVEGLAQIVRDPQTQGPHRVGLAGVTRDHQGGRAVEMVAHTGQGVQSIQALHPDVQDHQVQGLAFGHLHRILSAPHGDHAMAFVLQDARQQLTHGSVVFQNQDTSARDHG